MADDTILGMTPEHAFSVALQLDELRLRDLDAIVVCNQAIRCLTNETRLRQIEEILQDHERHVREIANVVHNFKAQVVRADCPSAMAEFILGKMGEDPGDERHVLLKFKMFHELVMRAYEEAVGRDLPLEAATIVQTAAEDERRHYAWAVRELEKTRLAGREMAPGP